MTGSPRKPSRRSGAARIAAALACALGLTAAVAADPKLLPPEQAFRFSARALDERTLEARFAVADGYYLYRDKFVFALEPQPPGFAAPQLPPGKLKDDQFFGKVETYRGEVVVNLPLPAAAAGQSIVVAADSQGCADAGVCYPANRQKITLVIPAAGKGPGAVVEAYPRKKSWFN
ncbi:MAG: protein-disulfide reductase DsbD N-terminal domain-containing protein [Betaproteobacteria bacterium]